jgi:hypothetical protein
VCVSDKEGGRRRAGGWWLTGDAQGQLRSKTCCRPFGMGQRLLKSEKEKHPLFHVKKKTKVFEFSVNIAACLP